MALAGPEERVGLLCGRACQHMISKFLAGSMMELVEESSRICIYDVSESSRADFGVNESQYTCIPFHFTPYLYGANPMWHNTSHYMVHTHNITTVIAHQSK